MSETVILRYHRIPKTALSEGYVLFRPGNGKRDLPICGFENSSFAEMLTYFAEVLQAYPDALGSMQRDDRPGLPEVPLEESTTALLRTDTAAAITAMTYVVAAPTARPKAPLPPFLMVGEEVLAAAFGDRIYCRARSNKREMECPGCGKWQRMATPFLCTSCRVALPLLYSEDGRWGHIATTLLLASGLPRFFLPRHWNGGRNWITHEELQTRYEKYLTEKNAT